MIRLVLAAVLAASPLAHAAAVPTSAPQATQEDLTHLRDALGEAYNKGDIEGMLRYLHPDVVILFPDGEIIHGREGLRAYYQKMLKSPDAKVKGFHSSPSVEGRQMRGDVDLSWGKFNDVYDLTDGSTFGLDSRFTTTLVKLDEGPTDTGGWVIRSFHASTNAFDNPVLAMATRRSLTTGFAGGAGLGLLVGIVATRLLRRPRTAP